MAHRSTPAWFNTTDAPNALPQRLIHLPLRYPLESSGPVLDRVQFTRSMTDHPVAMQPRTQVAECSSRIDYTGVNRVSAARVGDLLVDMSAMGEDQLQPPSEPPLFNVGFRKDPNSGAHTWNTPFRSPPQCIDRQLVHLQTPTKTQSASSRGEHGNLPLHERTLQRHGRCKVGKLPVASDRITRSTWQTTGVHLHDLNVRSLNNLQGNAGNEMGNQQFHHYLQPSDFSCGTSDTLNQAQRSLSHLATSRQRALIQRSSQSTTPTSIDCSSTILKAHQFADHQTGKDKMNGSVAFPQTESRLLRSKSPPSMEHCRLVQHGALKGEYRIYLHDAVSAEAALPHCVIGAVELCTFFPNHTRWPNALLRLKRNGWTIKDIACAQLLARNRLQRRTLEKRNAALRHQITKAGQEYFDNAAFSCSTQEEMNRTIDDADATTWQPSNLILNKLSRSPQRSLDDASLVECARGVVNWPQKDDVGLVTQCILLALQHGDEALCVSDVPRLIQWHHFRLPSEANDCAAWDKRGHERFLKAIEDIAMED